MPISLRLYKDLGYIVNVFGCPFNQNYVYNNYFIYIHFFFNVNDINFNKNKNKIPCIIRIIVRCYSSVSLNSLIYFTLVVLVDIKYK